MNKNALTAVEVAEILQIAKNTVYELVKRGELNCYKVGRKMRFTYEDVEEYIERQRKESRKTSSETGAGGEKQQLEVREDEPAVMQPVYADSDASDSGIFRICGQDDIISRLLQHMNRQMPQLKTEQIHKGSYESLIRLYKDQVIAAASHMWDPETDSYNVPFVKRMLPGCPVVIIQICRRTEGLYVARGNPKGIKGWEDFARPDIRLANREPGAGTRILLDEHLQLLDIDPEKIPGYNHFYSSHLAVAGSVSKGESDTGVGTMRTALSIRGISFIPLQEEDYQLVIKKRDMNRPDVQQMLKVLQSDELREEYRYLNGYDVTDMGKIIME